ERAGSDALEDRRFSRRDVDDRRPDALARMSRRRLRLVVSGHKQKQPPAMVRYADLRQPGQGAPLPPAPLTVRRTVGPNLNRLSVVLPWLSRPHSPRNATIGSTFVARRAGKKQASKATASRTKGAAINVVGSVAVTSNNNPANTRVSAKAASKPI